MITINYGDAKIIVKPTLLNEQLSYELETAELRAKAFDADNKVTDNVSLIKLLKANYEYFAGRVVSVDNLFDADSNPITLQDVKELKLPQAMLNQLINANTQAQQLALDAEDVDPKKN